MCAALSGPPRTRGVVHPDCFIGEISFIRTIWVCVSVSCHIMGADELADVLRQLVTERPDVADEIQALQAIYGDEALSLARPVTERDRLCVSTVAELKTQLI